MEKLLQTNSKLCVSDAHRNTVSTKDVDLRKFRESEVKIKICKFRNLHTNCHVWGVKARQTVSWDMSG